MTLASLTLYAVLILTVVMMPGFAIRHYLDQKGR